MKSISTTMKKAAFLPLVCLSFICFGQTEKPAKNDPGKNAAIEFLKSENGHLFFEVNLREIPSTGCIISISNEEEQLIFEDQVRTTSYHKTFQVPNEGSSKIYFDVNGKKYRLRQSFDLRYKVETKWEVTKL